MAVPENRRLLSALESNWQAEMEGFHTYAALSEKPTRIVGISCEVWRWLKN